MLEEQKAKIQEGDFFLVDSNKTGPKVVKYFMTAPTIYQHYWRKLRGTQEEVKYYHAGMFISRYQIIEQQGKVVIKDSGKLLNTHNRVLIFRKKGITAIQQRNLHRNALLDIGRGYDGLNCIGKLLTWLTGIKFFARYIEWPRADVCINRIAYWAKQTLKETFGAKTHSELTTHLVYKYIKTHPEKFIIVYETE